MPGKDKIRGEGEGETKTLLDRKSPPEGKRAPTVVRALTTSPE